jgi:hypothetical protein
LIISSDLISGKNLVDARLASPMLIVHIVPSDLGTEIRSSGPLNTIVISPGILLLELECLIVASGFVSFISRRDFSGRELNETALLGFRCLVAACPGH